MLPFLEPWTSQPVETCCPHPHDNKRIDLWRMLEAHEIRGHDRDRGPGLQIVQNGRNADPDKESQSNQQSKIKHIHIKQQRSTSKAKTRLFRLIKAPTHARLKQISLSIKKLKAKVS